MAGTELRQYDPIQVVGSWVTVRGSTDILNGTIDPGDFLTITKDNPRWAREHDRAGNTTRVKNNNRGGSVTVNLSASSPTNTELSALAVADDVTENIVGALVIRDLNGNTLIEADGAFLEDAPAPSFGSERGARAWTWQCAAIRTFLGGHDVA